MGDNYQDRKDIDRLIDSVYDLDGKNLIVVSFEEDNNKIKALKTIEAIFKYYALVDDDYARNFYTKDEVDEIISNLGNE